MRKPPSHRPTAASPRRPSARTRPAALLVALLLAAPAAAAREGDCPTVSGGATGAEAGEAPRDALPIRLREGMVLGIRDLLILRQLLPKEIWRHREAFFHEGMRMEIGPCHRSYPLPHFVSDATARHAAAVRLDRNGGLRGYRAGVPFPPDRIDPQAPDAALRWAWDLELRFRGGGHRGRFRIVDFPRNIGSEEVYEGDFYLLPTRGRADLADSDYVVRGAEKNVWIAGGRFKKPTRARHLAWRQFRPLAAWRNADEPDDTFVYVPEMRKTRRASTSWVDGLFVPKYGATGLQGGGAVQFGGDLGGSVNPTSSRSAVVTTHAYRGFEGLVLRPNAYEWRLHGERDVLAPINASRTGFPLSEGRNFGTSGLSVASDRWEVRRAVVIEGALRRPDEGFRTVTYWVDRDTRVPLYRFTRTQGRRLVDVQIFVHRWAADRSGGPQWPGGLPVMVFDPVAQVSYDAIAGGGGWRRESFDVSSLPFSEDDLPGLTSTSALDRGR